MIGNGINDIQAGQRVGCRTIFLGRVKCDLCAVMQDENVKPSYIASNLYAASKIIKKEEKQLSG